MDEYLEYLLVYALGLCAGIGIGFVLWLMASILAVLAVKAFYSVKERIDLYWRKLP